LGQRRARSDLEEEEPVVPGTNLEQARGRRLQRASKQIVSQLCPHLQPILACAQSHDPAGELQWTGQSRFHGLPPAPFFGEPSQ